MYPEYCKSIDIDFSARSSCHIYVSLRTLHRSPNDSNNRHTWSGQIGSGDIWDTTNFISTSFGTSQEFIIVD